MITFLKFFELVLSLKYLLFFTFEFSGKFICTEDYTTCEIGPGTDVLTVTVLSFICVGNGVGAGTGYPIGSDGISAGFIFLT